ncbi:unnamed protein product [Pleuronectes platessa]|uniref:Uncharacterized protein n=1 Tax=Pleuronectes platessa TaxID=8262 RepID=A0A9N7YN03_PLEPL|nr:unnamed protein product [Pleuronectes platessa]
MKTFILLIQKEFAILKPSHASFTPFAVRNITFTRAGFGGMWRIYRRVELRDSSVIMQTEALILSFMSKHLPVPQKPTKPICYWGCANAASVTKVNADMGQEREDDILTGTGNASASSAALGHKDTLKARSSENTICQSHPT